MTVGLAAGVIARDIVDNSVFDIVMVSFGKKSSSIV